jgi:hypothetical protein
MRSVEDLFPPILEKIRVLLFQGKYHPLTLVALLTLSTLGQFDFRDGVVSNEAWIRHLNWSGRNRFLKAPRRVSDTATIKHSL